ncbi:DUF3667 domain-containing protein [Hymenobacter busanensis]|uniref:DUF3667 domain-containing protein n=1 Tax=Hymenobacter busanensis TaxID=2607656 RepID=A0A7L5A200_9BACT|nr:DUF3667 domain-containing protein [Hymenobacter busanensis]KAA9327077.1 DUF3667 domain-containing protein [Hymenobacter busanensis]QHJ09528.1 DUF3667 domain-containing protein [Hymenobacter busanensis]
METLAPASSPISVPATAHAAVHSAPHACLNCGHPLSSRFCPDCGQPANTHRITTAHLLHDIPHSVWHVDRGLPYTIREMLLRPGRTVRRYLAGERVDFFRPFALVLLLAGILSFLILASHIQLVDELTPSTDPHRAKMVEANRFVFKYFAWFTVAMVPGYALFSWALLRRLRYNFAEHVVANALVMGAIIFIQMLCVPLLVWASGTPYFKPVYYAESFTMPLFQLWAFGNLAVGGYHLGGALWRSFVIAFVGLIINSLLITWVSEAAVSFKH